MWQVAGIKMDLQVVIFMFGVKGVVCKPSDVVQHGGEKSDLSIPSIDHVMDSLCE